LGSAHLRHWEMMIFCGVTFYCWPVKFTGQQQKVNTIMYINLSTCYSVMPLTCSIHCVEFLERHNTCVMIAHSTKPIERMLKTLLKMLAAPNHLRNVNIAVYILQFVLELPPFTFSFTRSWLHIQFIQTMKRRGDSTSPWWSPTPITRFSWCEALG